MRFQTGRLLYFDENDSDFAPGIDGKIWNDIPLETWFLEARGKMGSRNFTAPFVAYGAALGRNSEIREERERHIFPHRKKRQTKGNWGKRTDNNIECGD